MASKTGLNNLMDGGSLILGLFILDRVPKGASPVTCLATTALSAAVLGWRKIHKLLYEVKN